MLNVLPQDTVNPEEKAELSQEPILCTQLSNNLKISTHLMVYIYIYIYIYIYTPERKYKITLRNEEDIFTIFRL